MAGQLTPDEMLYPNIGQIKAEVVWQAKKYATCVKMAKEALQGLIALGYAEAVARELEEPDKRRFAQHWTAYLAYKGRYQQMVGLPSTVDARDEGSSSYFVTQIQLMADLAAAELAAAEDVITAAAQPVATVPRGSRTPRVCFENF